MDYAFTDCDRLSKEIWCFITSWLDVWEILNLSLSQKSFKFLLTSKTVWNFQIKNYLPLNLISDKLPKVPPQKLFIHIYNKYNNMRNHLAQIILKVSPNMNAIDWLEANYKNNAKKKEELETIITENYHSLPSDYYILFRLLDGQDMLVHHFPEDVCFFGGYHFNEKFYEFEYLPLSQPEFPVLHKMKLHTFAINRETGIRYYVDFHNIFNCGVGSILTFLNQRMEHGTIIFRVFILKQSLFQLLEELQRCSFSSQKRLIDHFDTLYSPQSDVTTEGIRIRAFSIFNPWEMSASGFLFAYQIRISSNGLKGKWRLTTRHLIITDGNNQEEVEGVEVSEKTLELHEKGEDLLYESWINTQRLVSSLKGYLYFVNLETKQEVRAVIGEIIMEFPKGCSLLECKQSDLSIHMLIDRREDV